MDPYRLRILRELGERGSLAAVARALHVTPSAVSQQLRALQRPIAVPLTEKRGRALILTDAGAALAAAAVDVAIALDNAERAVQDHLEDLAAPVSLAGFQSAALTYFPLLLTHLAAHGGPPVYCSEADVAQAASPTLIADFDLVLAQRMDHTPPWPSRQLTAIPLIHEPLLVGIPQDHPLANRAELSAADVAIYPWISVHDGYPLQPTLDLIAAAAGHTLTIAHRINDLTLASAIVASGAALTLLPAYTTPVNDAVTLRELTDVRAGRSIDVLTRPETLHRASALHVLNVLRTLVTAGTTPAGS